MMIGAGIIGIFLMLIFIGLSVFFFIFWILMIIDCVKRKFKEENDKIIWVIVIIFAGIIGAAIYYFVVKNKK
jgi:hypothetical protein